MVLEIFLGYIVT